MNVHVVSHTHWDREWYLSAGRFRQRLVALIDDLLADPPSTGAAASANPGSHDDGMSSFLLDGQAVVLEDYLAVRPECAADIASLLRSGALEAGPWFVLADELIPSGEALVRNLLAGRRVLRALRAESPPVLYCPDSFGHPAALPELARGFGLGLIVLWRGFGGARWPAGDAAWWESPSGDRVLLYHLPSGGYEFGANLPIDAAGAAARWSELDRILAPRARAGAVLLLNGADHHARQPRLTEAIAALREAAAPSGVHASSLKAFARVVEEGATTADLPVVRGELRDSYGYTWTLQGTLATRAAQKRAAAIAGRLLTRDVEPWAALVGTGSVSGSRFPLPASRFPISGRSRRALLDAAWRDLLLAHPHDTLCGVSIDQVARALDARMEEVAAQSAGIRDDALDELIGHDREGARVERDRWHARLVLRNPVPRERSGVAIVEVATFLAHVAVGPPSGSAAVDTRAPSRSPLRIGGLGRIQVLDRRVAHERTEAATQYPDDDLVEVARAAVWVADMPAYGVRAFAVGGRRRNLSGPEPVRAAGRVLENGRLSVRVAEAGEVELTDQQGERTITNLVTVEDADDLGDLYTPSIRGLRRAARFIGARVRHRGPLRGSIETRWRVTLRKGETTDLRLVLVLDAGAAFLRIGAAGENGARDHRLRLRLATDVGNPRVVADAAFGPVVREPLVISPDEARMEAVVPTAPLHRYVSLFGADRGATLFSDGLAEYEATGEGAVLVTLVRAVGELSRGDLPERPGHAGWPAPTPAAQCLGPFAAELAVMLHGPHDDATIDLIERASDDVLLPITGRTLRSAIAIASRAGGIALDGGGLAFSCAKESENGKWLVLRCVNLLEHEVDGRWVLADGAREAWSSRLDETPGEALSVANDSVPFRAPPRAVVTILVGR